MIAGSAQAPMPMWGRTTPSGAQLLVDDHLLHRPGVPPPGARPVGHHQAGVDQACALRLLAVEHGQLGHHRGQLGPHPIGLVGQIGGQRPARPAVGQVDHLPARKSSGSPSSWRSAMRPLQMEMGVVLPGEADAAQQLQAVLGAVDVAVEGQGAGGGRSQRGLVGSVRCPTASGRVPGHRGHLLHPDRHVGQPVLDRLELADGAPELDAHLGVLGGGVEAPPGPAGVLRPPSGRRPPGAPVRW